MVGVPFVANDSVVLLCLYIRVPKRVRGNARCARTIVALSDSVDDKALGGLPTKTPES